MTETIEDLERRRDLLLEIKRLQEEVELPTGGDMTTLTAYAETLRERSTN